MALATFGSSHRGALCLLLLRKYPPCSQLLSSFDAITNPMISSFAWPASFFSLASYFSLFSWEIFLGLQLSSSLRPHPMA